MVHDIFFDCPQCKHTIKASSDLVGVPVDCPDCGNEFKVPRILDGMNPRLRNQKRPIPAASSPKLGNALEDLLQLEISLQSLLRRQRQQIHQLDFLEENCNLIFKQLNLIERPGQTLPQVKADATGSPSETVSGVPGARWEKWSLVCGGVTLLVSLMVGILLLRSSG